MIRHCNAEFPSCHTSVLNVPPSKVHLLLTRPPKTLKRVTLTLVYLLVSCPPDDDDDEEKKVRLYVLLISLEVQGSCHSNKILQFVKDPSSCEELAEELAEESTAR